MLACRYSHHQMVTMMTTMTVMVVMAMMLMLMRVLVIDGTGKGCGGGMHDRDDAGDDGGGADAGAAVSG
eukprot:746015-Alexandrium_andersonii.AAC.1